MPSFEDVRWSELTGEYRTRLDTRPLLKRLETESDTSQVWQELCDELHHQEMLATLPSHAARPFAGLKSF
jgi:hypothetical protein